MSLYLQVVMWLNQNFLLPEGIDSPDVTFTALRGEGLLRINMQPSGEVDRSNYRYGLQIL